MKQLGSASSLILFGLAALALSACGGGQSVDRVGWSSVVDAIPSDATWAMYADLDADEMAQISSSLPNTLQSVIDAGGGGALDEFAAATGIDLREPGALGETGIDLGGEFAVFSTSVTPVALIRLSDEEAFLSVVDRVVAYHPDVEVTDVEVAGGPMRRLAVEAWAVDVGVRDGWGLVRVGRADGQWGVAEDELLRALQGPADGGFSSSDIATDLFGRAVGDEAVASVMYARTGLVDEIAALLRSGELDMDALDAMGLAEAPADDPACAAASARLQSMWPWVGAIEFRTPGRAGYERSAMVAHLDEATAARLAPAFGEALSVDDALLDDAVMFFSAEVALRGLVDAVEGDPETASCGGLGALSGMLAQAATDNARLVDYNLGYVDGGFAFALFDVRMAGFLPFVDSVLMIGSNNATALFEEAQQLLEDAGASGSTDTSAPMTSIDYQLLHLAIEAIRADDRNVFAVGEVPRAVTNALAADARDGDGVEFMQARLNGARLADVLEQLIEMAGNTGSLPPEAVEELERSAAQSRAIDRIDARGRIESGGLVIETTSVYDQDALFEAMGGQ